MRREPRPADAGADGDQHAPDRRDPTSAARVRHLEKARHHPCRRQAEPLLQYRHDRRPARSKSRLSRPEGDQGRRIYDADPVTNPKAKKFARLDYLDLINKDLRVMDHTAVTLCRENKIPIIVFDLSHAATWKASSPASRSHNRGEPNDRGERQDAETKMQKSLDALAKEISPFAPASQPVAGGTRSGRVLRESDALESARHHHIPEGALDHHPAMGPDDHRAVRESHPEIRARTESATTAADPVPIPP